MTTPPSTTPEQDEATIRGMIDDFARAVERMDLDGIVAHEADDVVLFDAIPPYKTEGLAAVRSAWEMCMPHMPPSLKSDIHDLKITVGGDVAFAHYLFRFGSTELPDHPCGQSWMRVTQCLQRQSGRWRNKHVHISQPFNPMDSTAWPITDPADLSAPDYGAMEG